MNRDALSAYTQEVLSFSLAGASQTPPARSLDSEHTARHVQRILRMMERSNAKNLVIFGAGTGELINSLAAQIMPNFEIIVCELNAHAARAVAKRIAPEVTLVSDSSPWALACLMGIHELVPPNALLMLNPELAPEKSRPPHQNLQRMLAGVTLKQIPEHTAQPDISAAAILSPQEPDLDLFFAQFPSWIKELCIVWDAEEIPAHQFQCACKLKQSAHPLDDFASQRNRMLSMCCGNHVLYLDGDECFHSWQLIPSLCSLDLEGFYFPRQTLFPDESHAKTGFGLWPDLQLRLFRNKSALHFTRPIHEKLAGLSGAVGIPLGLPIKHHSRLRKTESQLIEKLEKFDKTGNLSTSHRLNRDYPTLPCHVLQGKADSLLILPENPA